MIHRVARAAAAVGAALGFILTSGCASSPAPHTYVLGTPLQVQAVTAGAAGAAQVSVPRTVQLQAVHLPDFLDNEDILLRKNGHELLASPTGRWAERLSSGVSSALGAALATRLPGYGLEPARPRDPSALQILVDIDAFDVWRDGRCALSASWSILGTDSRGAAVSGRGVFNASAASPAAALNDAAIVSVMAATVDQLADALATALHRMEP